MTILQNWGLHRSLLGAHLPFFHNQCVIPWFTVSRAGASTASERANSRSVAGRRATNPIFGLLVAVVAACLLFSQM